MTEQSEHRDYRDDQDVDEVLDLIRVADRANARQLYRSSLDVAYHQGRSDRAKETADEARELLSDVRELKASIDNAVNPSRSV